jgi:hypothetical protein
MAHTKTAEVPASAQPGYTIRKHDRNWKVIDPADRLVCITLYKKGREGSHPPPRTLGQRHAPATAEAHARGSRSMWHVGAPTRERSLPRD